MTPSQDDPLWLHRDGFELFEPDAEAQLHEFAQGHSLVALNDSGEALILLRPYHPKLNAPPDPGDPKGLGLAMWTPTTSMYLRLPAALECVALRFSGLPERANDVIELETHQGTTVTHFAELYRTFDPFSETSEDEREQAFASLSNERIVPTPRAPIEVSELHSERIGTLQQDADWDDCWRRDAVAIPYLDGALVPVEFRDVHPGEDPDFVHHADRALQRFFGMNSATRRAHAPRVLENCREFLDMVVGEEGEDWADEMLAIEDPMQVWQFVQPQTLAVGRGSDNGDDVFIALECHCDWEDEHGLLLVFKNGEQLTRVSAQDGHYE